MCYALGYCVGAPGDAMLGVIALEADEPSDAVDDALR